MRRSPLPIIVFAQFAGTSLWFAGNAVLTGQASFSPAWLTASVQMGFIAGTLIFSVLGFADRLAASRLFLMCSIAGAVVNAAIPFFHVQTVPVLGLRVATGFFLAGIYPVGMKIAADCFPKGLGNALGWLVGALVLGTAFPHLLKGQLTGWPPAPLFWAISGLAASGGILLYLLVPGSPSRSISRPNFWGDIQSIVGSKSFRSAGLGYLGHMWELYTFWAFVPLLLFGHPAFTNGKNTGSVTAFGIIAVGALGCVLGGKMALFTGGKKVSIWTLGISGICSLLLPLAIHLPAGLYLVFLMIWGMAVVADSPQLSTLAALTAPAHLKGTALTLLTCLGFSLTVVSLLFIQYLAARLPQPHLALVALAPGPLMGLLSLRKGAF